jgi:hypothetical protein
MVMTRLFADRVFNLWCAARDARAKASVRFPVFLICMLGLVAAPSEAATLLVEFTHKISTLESGNPLPTTVPFTVSAGERTIGNLFYWQDEYGPGDVGMTFNAPTEVVEGATLAISFPTARYSLDTGPANFSTETSFHPAFCQINDCVHVLVPDVASHAVTSVERVIDQLQITRGQGDFYRLEAAQRIRFWGEPIPEPQTIVLLAAGIGWIASCYRCNSARRNIGDSYLASQSPHQPVPSI